MVQRTAQKPATSGSKKTGAKPHSGLDRDALLKAYEKMSRIRAFEDRLHEENATGDIPGFIHLYSGQEAIAVGVCENLSDADYIGSTHRGHGHCIAKGCDLNGMMAEIFGKDDGLCRGKGGSMHIADLSVGMLGANAIVGGAPSLAIGAALSGKTLRNGVIAASFTGDGGSNQGTVFEAMNMAVVLDLPIVFVIENNGFGEATGTDYAVGAPDIAARAASFGMPAVKVDGTDFFAFTTRWRKHPSEPGPAVAPPRSRRPHSVGTATSRVTRSCTARRNRLRNCGKPRIRSRISVAVWMRRRSAPLIWTRWTSSRECWWTRR